MCLTFKCNLNVINLFVEFFCSSGGKPDLGSVLKGWHSQQRKTKASPTRNEDQNRKTSAASCFSLDDAAGIYRILPQLKLLPAQDELNLSEIHCLVFSNAVAVPHINSIFNIKHLICFRLPLSRWFYFCPYQKSFSLSFSDIRQITFYFLNHWQWFRK